MWKIMKCGQLFDSNTGIVKKNMDVLIEDNLIKEVGPSGVVKAPEDAEVVDLSDHFVMPGLIEGHGHIGMHGNANVYDTILFTTIGMGAIKSIKNAQADLLAGITSVRDMGAFSYIDVDIKNAINSGMLWGPRLQVSGLCISATGGHGDLVYRLGTGATTFPESFMAYLVDGEVEARKAARKVIKYGADVVKLMATGGVLSNDANPGAADLTYDEMKAACDIAKMHGKLVATHAHGAEGIKNAIRAGVDSVEHGMLIDDEGIEMLKENHVFLVPTIIASQQTVDMGDKLPPLILEKAKRCLDQVHTNLVKMRALGVKVGFGTDVGTPGDPHGHQLREGELMMKLGGFTAEEVLMSATKVNSEMLHWDDKVGSVDPGKFADIIAFKDSPVEDMKNLTRCDFVMKDGFVYKQNGEATYKQAVL